MRLLIIIVIRGSRLEKFKWLGDNQQMIWKPDDFVNLMESLVSLACLPEPNSDKNSARGRFLNDKDSAVYVRK